MDKKQREARRHQEDVALSRALLWVVAAVVLEGLLVLVNRFYINYNVHAVDVAIIFDRVLRTLRVACPVLAAAALAWSALAFRRAQKATLPLLAAAGAGALAVCSHVAVKFKDVGVSMLFWLVIAWAVLAMVYYIYQKEFFLAACATGMSVLGLWFVRYGGLSIESGLLLAAIVGVLAVVLLLKKHDGVLPVQPPVSFLPRDCGYPVVLVSCLASAAALAAALALGAVAAYYLIFVMLAWIFALFVYYTVKLM